MMQNRYIKATQIILTKSVGQGWAWKTHTMENLEYEISLFRAKIERKKTNS
jgi:hypothetical protein